MGETEKCTKSNPPLHTQFSGHDLSALPALTKKPKVPLMPLLCGPASPTLISSPRETPGDRHSRAVPMGTWTATCGGHAPRGMPGYSISHLYSLPLRANRTTDFQSLEAIILTLFSLKSLSMLCIKALTTFRSYNLDMES